MYLWPRQWMGHYSDAVDMSDYAVSASLCWQWRARVCVRVCSCVLCECHYCLLSGSRQVTWLPCLSLCSSLISSAAYLNEWLSSMYGCVCVCMCAATPGHCKYTKAIFMRAQFDFNIYRPSGQVSILPPHGSNMCALQNIAWYVECLTYAVTHSIFKTHTSVFLTYSIFIPLRPRC